jgi:hypothetical protein
LIQYRDIGHALMSRSTQYATRTDADLIRHRTKRLSRDDILSMQAWRKHFGKCA